MPRNHQVREQYAEYEVEAVLDRQTVPSERRGTKVQYLLKFVGYPDPEWTDYVDCKNCISLIQKFRQTLRAAAVNDAGPAGDRGEVVMEGEASLFCEALLATEASPLGIGDPAEEAGQPYNEPPAVLPPAVVPPAVVPIQPPATSSIVAQTKKKKKRCKRSAENRLRHIQCLNCRERGHIKKDCPKRSKGPVNESTSTLSTRVRRSRTSSILS
ncbi:hypothetical protein GHT06_007715 [Daphnia sinensis]|uniref:CCHC-type domain-containing protein n=1 Tax=Daphnia sinensis TaxID=1820382 RepID=A0AAD5L2S8_9CRUS|nr:hypothetical protein GHT06_007715 [Daphnia sinensis]